MVECGSCHRIEASQLAIPRSGKDHGAFGEAATHQQKGDPAIGPHAHDRTEPLDQRSASAYLSVKGVRDIASGLFVFILMAADATHLLGWVILAATIIPLADATIVLGNGGPKSIAWGVHGLTAAVMLMTSALLLIA